MAALLALLALIPATIRAEVTESVAQSIFTDVTPKQPKGRKVTDSFWYFGLQGGAVFPPTQDASTLLSGVFGYKHRIGSSDFMVGGQISGGASTLDQTGFFLNFAPTISYMRFPGGFYNSFEATLGLGFGYRQEPSGGFAFTPELNLTYWFNWFGIGLIICESFQKSGYAIRTSYRYDIPGNQFSAMARFAVRF